MNRMQIKGMVEQFNSVVEACKAITEDAYKEFDKILADLELSKTFTKAELNVINNKKFNCELITTSFSKDFVFPFQCGDPSYERGYINYSDEGVFFTGSDEFTSDHYSSYHIFCVPYDLIEAKMKEDGNMTEYNRLLDHKLRTFIAEVVKTSGLEAKQKQQQAIRQILRQMDQYGITSKMLEGEITC